MTDSPSPQETPSAGPTTPPPLSPSSAVYPRPAWQAAPPPRKTGRGWKIAAIVLALMLFFSVMMNIGSIFGSLLTNAGGTAMTDRPHLHEVLVEDNDSRDKIAVVPVEGMISSMPMGYGSYNMVKYIEDQLKLSERDERVKAVILKVNSPGGEVLASDDIAQAIDKFQTKSGKPVVAAMESLAASGGYYVSAPCRWIVANELTITGSIGVIMHGYNFRGLMKKVGVTPQVIKSGKFKDMLSFDKDLENPTPAEQDILNEERRMVQNMIDETFQKFKTVVSTGRRSANRENQSNAGGAGQPLSENWESYADGRILSGKEAHKIGLVDELGNVDVAVKRAMKLAGIGDANLIRYQQPLSFGDLFGFFGKSDAKTLKIDLGWEGLKLKPGLLYFLSPGMAP